MHDIAVVDVETTGLNPFRHNRVVEIAVIRLGPSGERTGEFETLVNPERDIGPSHIHGLETEDIIGAPNFSQVAGHLIQALNGCIAIAGHNVRFDMSFLEMEFERCGLSFPRVHSICTMHLAGGGTLAACCREYGVEFDGQAHSARADAAAAADLLAQFLRSTALNRRTLEGLEAPVWPRIDIGSAELMQRNSPAKRRDDRPTYLQQLLAAPRVRYFLSRNSQGVSEYLSLLSQILEDRVIDEGEGQALVEIAKKWGLTREAIENAHEQFISELARQSWIDDQIADFERRDLLRVGRLLGVDAEGVENLVQREKGHADTKSIDSAQEQWCRGLSVCFTGQGTCQIDGSPISRRLASELAGQRGLVVLERVTKKLDILVVSDPLTQSRKAQMARRYGTRVMQERVFWRSIGVVVE